MYTSDSAASASQIDLGFPLPPGHVPSNSTQTFASHPAQRSVYPSGGEGGRASTSTAASSHASTSTAQDRPRSVNGSQTHERDREDVEEEEARTPEKAPGGAVDKAVMASALVPAGAGVAAAALTQDRGGHGERGDGEMAEKLGIEDKHHFFAPQLKSQRRSVYKKIFFIFLGITLWLWACLSFFWGSTYKLTSGISNLNVRFVTFDTDSSALLNAPITQQANYLASLPSSVTHLGWEVRSASNYPNGLADVQREVLQQECWAFVVVNANATSAWRAAVRNGDGSYDPNGAIGIYYMGARFYQVQYLYTESLIKEELSNPLSTARAEALQAFNTYAANNAGAIAAAARSPQTLGVAFGYNIFDLRPIQDWAWAGAAPMEASLIYFVIFAFTVVFTGAQIRAKTGIEDRLTFRAKVTQRVCWPLFAFFWIALWQTLVVRAFQVPLTDYLGRAAFVTLWALNYVTIIAAGFALETMLCLVGIPFLPVFLILWIILNITSSFYPLEMLPPFYTWLRWTPFIHNVEAFKIIAYGTNRVSRLGYHFGILFALIGVEALTLPLAMVFERWSSDKSKRREVWDKREKKEGA
ncbi:uncharacterized protein MKK02DRAFT_37535 [Dioszegia hungarica]|uniref:DUF3533 domain-containing protein n=1 Tax=Dioszegia hungarica TaxID=4972 RepID=A0AA38H5Q4_9TREE|nr:uncharacterized protein MKK02DRAFT_37535 [Dioszegia hungarica]KAI9634655.1 hypothetical protein MKK02DRAFT_37535 [Dioszegia hungarica]